MSRDKVFNPAWESGQIISVSSTTANVEIAEPSNNTTLVVTNTGATTCYVNIGSTAALSAATTAGYPVLPTSQILLTKRLDDKFVSAITASSTTSLHVMPGNGR